MTDNFGSIELIADTLDAVVEMEKAILILARLVVTQVALEKRWTAETSASFPDYPDGNDWKVGYIALMAGPFGDLDRLTYKAISLLHSVEGDDPTTDPDVAPYLQAVVTTDPTPAEREDGPESPQCTCSRCGRVTSEMAKDFCEWEVEEDGETMICPGCLTSDEEAAIYEDVEQPPETRRLDYLERHVARLEEVLAQVGVSAQGIARSTPTVTNPAEDISVTISGVTFTACRLDLRRRLEDALAQVLDETSGGAS